MADDEVGVGIGLAVHVREEKGGGGVGLGGEHRSRDEVTGAVPEEQEIRQPVDPNDDIFVSVTVEVAGDDGGGGSGDADDLAHRDLGGIQERGDVAGQRQVVAEVGTVERGVEEGPGDAVGGEDEPEVGVPELHHPGITGRE